METLLTLSKQQAADELIEELYEDIDYRYGPGRPTSLPYHNAPHSEEVVWAAAMIADSLIANKRLNPSGRPAVLVAAAGHDGEQFLGRGKNEILSYAMTALKMKRYNLFDTTDFTIVRNGILSTQVTFDEGQVLQHVEVGDTPSEAVADADLSNLGAPYEHYRNRTLRWFSEINRKTPPGDLPAAWEQFLVHQLVLMETHQFYTPEAVELFPHQPENLEATRLWSPAEVPELIAA